MLEFHIGWPQIIWVILMCINLGMSMMQHGEPREGRNNAWVTALSLAIIVPLLYWGGFFSS